MDFSVAGYLTVIPALMIIGGIWCRHRWLNVAMKAYFAVASLLLAVITILDIGLYAYWGFRLDATPLFYFSTSPEAAFASVTWHQVFLAIAGAGVIACGLYFAFARTVCRIEATPSRRGLATVVMTVLAAALFIPIRGGFTVSTMNPGRAYFSSDKVLNHAAVNPTFNLLYSLTHQNNFQNEYRFMTDAEATAALDTLATLTSTRPTASPDSIGILTGAPTDTPAKTRLLNCSDPDIYLVILESFSARLMPSLGGEPVAECLDSVARTGISFTNFYANSFRTDRALPSILSALPAQPSTSILKYADKTEALPSIANELKKSGYATEYYYGGDINFANINAYIVSAGFDRIVRDKDFPVAERQSKWGAHDHLLFNRVISDLETRGISAADATPRFTVIQTSSSHEPFEVPFSDPRFASHPQKNAFAYTDRTLRDFLEALKQSPRYGCTLVILVPDHLGAWPLDLQDAPARHHVPLVLTGGALANSVPQTIPVAGSQIDIAATLLGTLGKNHDAFTFSKDMLDAAAPHYAVFTEPSIIGIVTDNDTIVYNTDARIVEKMSGTAPDKLEEPAKAYLQNLYKVISDL